MEIVIAKKSNWLLILGLPFIIFSSSIVIAVAGKLRVHNPLLSAGILADLLITAPVLYLLAIRKTDISKWTAIRVFMVGLLLASFLIAPKSNAVLQILKTWIASFIEVFVIIFIAKKIISVKRRSGQQQLHFDFLPYCRSVCYQIAGNENIANIFASEIAVFYYTFLGFKNKSVDYRTAFSSYKENGLPTLLVAILSIFLIETTAVHFLLVLWNKTFAWVITGLSIYSCLQLLGHIRALKARPILINNNSLEIHNGLAGDAIIEFSNIERFERSNKKPADNKAIKIALFNVFEGHNMIVYLKAPIEVTKIFGIKRQTATVLFFVDKHEEFVKSLDKSLKNRVS